MTLNVIFFLPEADNAVSLPHLQISLMCLVMFTLPNGECCMAALIRISMSVKALR